MFLKTDTILLQETLSISIFHNNIPMCAGNLSRDI